MRRRKALRGFRPRWLATAVLVVGIGLTAGGFVLAQSWVASAEDDALREHATQTGAIITSFSRQVEAILTAGSIIADLTEGDPEAFRQKIEQRIDAAAGSGISLLERRSGRWEATATVGGTAPVLLPRFSAADHRRLDRIAAVMGKIELVKIARLDGKPAAGFAVSADGKGSLLVYAESAAPLVRLSLFRPRGLEFALYIREQRPGLLLASSPGGLAMTGNTVEQELRFGAEKAILVVGGGTGLVGGLTAALPWLILGLGLATTLALALGIELSRRRAATQAERVTLVAQNEQLRELDRMKDELVATVSHELRTPLTSILGYLELLLEDADELTEEHRNFVEVIDRNARRLLGLVGDLLFMARLDAGGVELELDDVDLQEIARDCVIAQRPRAEQAGLTLELESDQVEETRGDRARLAQLLDNLVANAIKFTPSGGSVVVRLRRVGGDAMLEVEDTGMGIPAAEQVQVFDRFFRSSNAAAAAIQGTGLGLAISKAIVEAHGGTIVADSKEGDGSTFRIVLPLVPTREAAVSADALVR